MSTTIPDSIRRQVNAASALIARIIEGDWLLFICMALQLKVA